MGLSEQNTSHSRYAGVSGNRYRPTYVRTIVFATYVRTVVFANPIRVERPLQPLGRESSWTEQYCQRLPLPDKIRIKLTMFSLKYAMTDQSQANNVVTRIRDDRNWITQSHELTNLSSVYTCVNYTSYMYVMPSSFSSCPPPPLDFFSFRSAISSNQKWKPQSCAPISRKSEYIPSKSVSVKCFFVILLLVRKWKDV